MEHVSLGQTGLQVSRLAFGCSSFGSTDWMPWALPEEDALPIYRRAFDLGINFFDNADSYSTGLAEQIFGNVLKTLGIPRDTVVIATKVFGAMGPDVNQRGLSRKHIRHAVEDSLRRLGTDYIDLYQIHRLDLATPAEELLVTLDDLVREGKVLYLGASSMYTWQFARLQELASANGLTRFVTMQNKYNLLYREEEREMIPYCINQSVGLIPYSPLARGLLTGSRRRGTRRSQVVRDFTRKEDEDIVSRVIDIAERRGAEPSEIALSWLLGRPGVVAPIIGATSPNHVDGAVRALDIQLSQTERDELENLYQPQNPQLDRNVSPSHNDAASAALDVARSWR